MNKETRKFKKVMKARKKRVNKKKELEQERLYRRSTFSISKSEFLEEKKKFSNNIVKARQERIIQLKKNLHIKESELISLGALEKIYENITHKSAK